MAATLIAKYGSYCLRFIVTVTKMFLYKEHQNYSCCASQKPKQARGRAVNSPVPRLSFSLSLAKHMKSPCTTKIWKQKHKIMPKCTSNPTSWLFFSLLSCVFFPRKSTLKKMTGPNDNFPFSRQTSVGGTITPPQCDGKMAQRTVSP